MDFETGTFPPPLRKGDTVAFVSPSMRVNNILPDFVERGIAFFEQLGFHVKVIFSDIEHLDFSTQISHRCNEIHSAFSDPDIKAIICTVGGIDSHELLPHLDYELIKRNAKIFVGFSDITSLHMGLHTQSGLRTFYGPMAVDPFGGVDKPDEFTTRNFLRLVTEEGTKTFGDVPVSKTCNTTPNVFAKPHGRDDSNIRPNKGWRWLRPGSTKGRILGGGLEPLMSLAGSKYFPDFHDKILLLETSMNEDGSKGAPLDKIRAQMASLRNIDVFDEIRGLIMGRPYGCGEEEWKQFDQIVLDQTRGKSFPVLVDVDVGHTDPIVTVPLNAMVSLDSEDNVFEILEHSVEEAEKGQRSTVHT